MKAYPQDSMLEAYGSEVHVHSHAPGFTHHMDQQRLVEHPAGSAARHHTRDACARFHDVTTPLRGLHKAGFGDW